MKALTTTEAGILIAWLAVCIETYPEMLELPGDELRAALYKLKSWKIYDPETGDVKTGGGFMIVQDQF